MSPENAINPYQLQNGPVAKGCLEAPYSYINFQFIDPPPTTNLHVPQTTLQPRTSSVESQILCFISENVYLIQTCNVH
jgi:hypothetical protein